MADWVLRGLTEDEMGSLSLTVRLRQEEAGEWEAPRWARIVEAIQHAVEVAEVDGSDHQEHQE